MLTGFVHSAQDVAAVFKDFSCVTTDDTPFAAKDEKIVWYGGWTVAEMVKAIHIRPYSVVMDSIGHLCSEAGYYRVALPVFGSFGLEFNHQKKQLQNEWSVISLPVLLTALAMQVSYWPKLNTSTMYRCDQTCEQGVLTASIGDVSSKQIDLRYTSPNVRYGTVCIGGMQKC